nr:MAG TPA: antitoxin [Caudoviricetes sp.]
MNIDKINQTVRNQSKTAVIAIRVTVSLKESFMNACSVNNVESSAVIRAMMLDYIEQTKNKKQ